MNQNINIKSYQLICCIQEETKNHAKDSDMFERQVGCPGPCHVKLL